MSLTDDQTYVNHLLDSSMVTLTNSINFSVCGSVNGDGTFTRTFEVGESAGYTENSL